MRTVNRSRAAGMLAITTVTIWSCASLIEIETPTTEELGQFISNLLLSPEVSCESLRSAFDVEYLELADTPDEAGMPYEEHWISTEDGELLRTWYLPTQLDRGMVILSMGASGELPCYLLHARLLVHNGWSVVMYEYRGFGLSSGETDINSLHTDLTAVLEWTVDYTDRDAVTLYGISLGTIPSVAIAVERPELVNGVVLDSPAAMELELARLTRVLGDQTQEIIEQLALPLRMTDLAWSLERPLLVLQGAQDAITPLWSVEIVFERAPGSKELVLFSDLGHAGAAFHDTGTYTFHLERFLSELWGQYTPLE